MSDGGSAGLAMIPDLETVSIRPSMTPPDSAGLGR